MRALHSAAAPVSWQRVAREHRKSLVPLGIVLAINVVVLLAVVLPLNRRVAANEQRAERAARAEQAARQDYRDAEAVREGNAQATKDLETFYQQVLPSNVAAARRILQSKLLALAKEHGVIYERGSADTEDLADSDLERFGYSATLTGEYEDIRAMIYDLETAPEFIVIDDIVLAEGRDADAPLAWSLELSTYYQTSAARAGSDAR